MTMLYIEEIQKELYNQQPFCKRLMSTDNVQHFYKLTFQNHYEFFLEASFDKSRFITREFSEAVLLCADDRIFVFSVYGQMLLALKIFEDIDFYKLINDRLFVFSELLVYKFTTKDFSIDQLIWLSDVLVDIVEKEDGFEIECFDNRKFFIS